MIYLGDCLQPFYYILAMFSTRMLGGGGFQETDRESQLELGSNHHCNPQFKPEP